MTSETQLDNKFRKLVMGAVRLHVAQSRCRLSVKASQITKGVTRLAIQFVSSRNALTLGVCICTLVAASFSILSHSGVKARCFERGT